MFFLGDADNFWRWLADRMQPWLKIGVERSFAEQMQNQLTLT